MTTKAIHLVPEISTPAKALSYLQELSQVVSDDALEHILDFHLKSEPEALRRCRQRDWLWLHGELVRLLSRWTEELPADIAEHRLIRIDQEEKAQKIVLLRKFVGIIAPRVPNH